MAVDIFHDQVSTKECCRTCGSNPQLPAYQADPDPTELSRPATLGEFCENLTELWPFVIFGSILHGNFVSKIS